MFQELLSKISVCLKGHRIPYMIIGGQQYFSMVSQDLRGILI